jgi:hypothetical protein
VVAYGERCLEHDDMGLGLRPTLLLTPLAAILLGMPAGLRGETNPVQAENGRPGSPAWQYPRAPEASDVMAYAGQVRSIDGYAWPMSVLPGGSVDLHVSAVPGTRYRVEVYRLGWYGGAGARLLGCVPTCTGDRAGGLQPASPPPAPATGEVDAGWSVTDTISVGADWPSGYYLAQLVITAGSGAGSARPVPFVVRPSAGNASKVVLLVPINTWQAYDGWGGKSLYDSHSVDGRQATQVSFDRPYMSAGLRFGLFYDEYQLVRYLERAGQDVTYITDADLSGDPGLLLTHRVVMTAGHGEYWTKVERDAFEAARASGVSLAFMGANTGYWQVRYADDGRTMIGYKSTADPIGDPSLQTIRFRDLGRPECQLEGVQYSDRSWADPSTLAHNDFAVVPDALGAAWFAGTGFAAGDTLSQSVGYEWDLITPGCATPPLTQLFHWSGTGGLADADSVSYVAPAGGRVFSAGSLQFSWALDGWRYLGAQGSVDARLERFVTNMLADMTAAPPSAAPAAAAQPPRAARRAPVLRRLSATPRRFRAQWSRRSAGGTGTRVRFELSGRALVLVTVRSALAPCWGRLACDGTARAGLSASFRVVGRTGATSVRFSGWLGRRSLAPGPYVLTARPVLAGVRGAPRTVRVTVLPPARRAAGRATACRC